MLRSAVHTAQIAALATWLLSAVSAQAQAPVPARFELDWEAPEDCMSEGQARAAIEGLLGTRASQAAGASIEVRISRLESDRYQAEIEARREGETGERSLHGESCARVSEATVLIAALVLDPSGAALRTAAQKVEPDPKPQAEADDEEDVDEPGPPLRFSIAARAVGDAGSLPTLTAGASLALGASLGALRFELQALAFLAQDATSGPVGGSGARIGLYSGALRTCLDAAHAFDRTFTLAPCLAIEAGLSTGEARGISDGQSRRGLWTAGLIGFSARQLFADALFLELLAEIGAALHRPRYQIDGFGGVFQASPVIGRTALSAGWIFH